MQLYGSTKSAESNTCNPTISALKLMEGNYKTRRP
jgi:hypothetical protein